MAKRAGRQRVCSRAGERRSPALAFQPCCLEAKDGSRPQVQHRSIRR